MSQRSTNPPDEHVERALEIARTLALAGVPIFVAKAVAGEPGKFHHPKGWQNTTPDASAIDAWQPGDALCAVGGHVADFLDCDAYNGGAASRDELVMGGAWPTSYGQQVTPSGGTHDVIVPLRAGKYVGVRHGLDVQGGAPDGSSRGFVYLAPTERPSKVTGELGAYRWHAEPDMELLAECAGSDDSGSVLAEMVRAKRSTPVEKLENFAVVSGDPFATPSRVWTEEEALAQIRPRVAEFSALRTPEDSGFNQKLNELAMFVGHFVPEFWSEADVTGWLFSAAEVNRSVEFQGAAGVTSTIRSGLRAGMRDPFAKRADSAPADVAPVAEPDAVDSLLARMLDRDALDSLPPPVPLIHGVLDKDSESWIIGAPGGFKSFVALDMGIHVALDRPWRGRRVESGPVVYMVAEGAKGITRRVRAWEETYGERMRDVYCLPFPVQVSDSVAWSVLVAACVRLKASLIVLDTQARITVGLEENSNTDMGRLIEAVRRLKEATGACVLVVHHTGRNGGDARGASALDGAQDTELRVDRPTDDAGRKALTATVSIDKQKDGDESAEWDIQMTVVELGVDEYGETVTSLALKPLDSSPFGAVRTRPEPDWEANLTDNMAEVVAVMRNITDKRGATNADITRYIKEQRAHDGRPGMAHSSVAKALTSLVARNVVLNSRGSARYTLSEFVEEVSE